VNGSRPGIVAVVVTFDSAAVIERCLDSLRDAAPRRGIEVRVVDNASADDSAARAAARLGEGHVVRRTVNGGFAAGVNEVLAGFEGDWLAVINPDLVVPRGALDALADALEADPSAGLAGPLVLDPSGRPEATTGWFPTLARERAHAWYLDHLLGREGRRRHLPAGGGPVEWLSGCAWLLRGDAIRATGPLDEEYFLYFEDVDYCRRLRESGWRSVAVTGVVVEHAGGQGSSHSAELAADLAGEPILHYFRKFESGTPLAQVLAALRAGWGIRRVYHSLRALLGDPRGRERAHRYELALAGRGRRRGHAD
jgi:GT2 family glycosyltransferase